MKILVVDDDFVSRIKLQELLTMHGTCDAAEDGKQALEMFIEAHKSNDPYKLITMDINLPDIKGQQVVHQIRQWEAEHKISPNLEAKVLMITKEKNFKTVMASFKEGCEWYLTKPFSPASLRQSLTELGLL